MTGDYEAAFVDLDGTVYRGDRLISGADRGIRTLRTAGIEVLFLSNKAIERRGDYVEKLAALGVEATRDRVINSGWVTARYVADRYPDREAFVIGEDPLLEEFDEAGVDATRDSPGDLLVASMDREFTYEKLTLALMTLENDTPFLATNPDRTCPTEDGAVPDAAGMIAAVEGVTDREVDTVVGKPSETMVETALEAVGAEAAECLVVGDRLETDIRMGERAGMTTVLVLSGVTDRVALDEAEVQPDYVVETLGDVADVLES
jgi:arabinose operon protein AraL